MRILVESHCRYSSIAQGFVAEVPICEEGDGEWACCADQCVISALFYKLASLNLVVRHIVKVNKQKLIMEEVERFDSITLDDLAEGAHLVSHLRHLMTHH